MTTSDDDDGRQPTLSKSASSFSRATRGRPPTAINLFAQSPPLLLVLLILATVGGSARGGRIVLPDASDATAQLYAEPGDVNVAALFPIHKPGAGRGLRCGAPRELGVLQRAEALAHAVREINANGSLLPGVRLGFYILDDCYADSVTLAQGLRLVQKPDSCDDTLDAAATAGASDVDVTQKSSTPLATARDAAVEAAEATGGATSPSTMSVMAPLDAIAVVAAESSTNSKQLAELLSLAHVPQVSYMATSSELSNRRRYPFFTRIVPPDRQQVQAIVSLLVRMNWRYFSFVYSYNDYGLGAYMHLLEAMGMAAASSFGEVDGGITRGGGGGAAAICMAAQRSIDVNADDSEYDETLDLLLFPPNGVKATAVVLYLTQTQATAMLRAAKRRDLHGEFVWIGSDAWGRSVQDFAGVEDVAIGSLHVKLASRNYPPFDDHFRSLRPPPLAPSGSGIGEAPSDDGSRPNPWLREFWLHPAAGHSVHRQNDYAQPAAASGSCTGGGGSGDCLLTVTHDGFSAGADNAEWHRPETTVSLVRDAVYLIARAVAALHRECLDRNARESGAEAAKAACNGSAFRRYIRPEELQLRMRGVRKCIDERYCYEVTPLGDGRRPYLIQTLQRKSDGSYALVQVGEYAQVKDSAATTMATTTSASESANSSYAAADDAFIIGAAVNAAPPPPLFRFTLDQAAIRWHPNATVEPSSGAPASRCAAECPPHHQKLRSLDFLQFCCWECEKCLAEEYASSDGGGGAADVPPSSAAGGATPVCRRCDKIHYDDIVIHQRPDATSNYTRCAPVVPEFLGGDHPIMLALAGVAAALVALWGVVLGCYIRFRDNRLIRATDRSLSGVMLAGVLCSYVGTFTYLAKPLSGCDSESKCSPRTDKAVCYANFLAFSVSFALLYAPILTRANRIYRIFNAALQPGRKPRFIESRHQLAITGAIILGQLVTVGAVFAVSGFTGSPVEIRNDAYVPPSSVAGSALASSWLACNTRFFALAPCACYNVLLLLACAYYAFKTRKLPHNYNESRFIAFCVFSSCVLWLALVGSYFTMTSTLYFSLPFVVSMLLQATLVLCCLFVPRLYALHYVVEDKVRSLSSALFAVGSAAGSGTGGGGSNGGSCGGLSPTPGGGSVAFLTARDLASVAIAAVDAAADRSGGGGDRRNKARFSGDGNSTLDSVVDSSSASDGTGENACCGDDSADRSTEKGGARSCRSSDAAERPPAVVHAAAGPVCVSDAFKTAALLATDSEETEGSAAVDAWDSRGGERGPVRTHSAAGSDYAESCDSTTALRDGLLNASVSSRTPIL